MSITLVVLCCINVAKLDDVSQHSLPCMVLDYSCLKERVALHLERRKEASSSCDSEDHCGWREVVRHRCGGANG